MKFQTRKWLCMPALVAALAIGGLTGCEIDQTREGDLPSVDVDVDADPGQLPRFDIDGPDVNVGMTTKMVKVPKVVVVMEEEEIEVPYIDVDLPDHDETERTLAVEVQVPGEGYDLDIEEATVVDGTLWVISELEGPEETPAEGPAMTVVRYERRGFDRALRVTAGRARVRGQVV